MFLKLLKLYDHPQNIDFEQLKKEIGDVLVCMVQLISQLSGLSLAKIVKRNWEKNHTNYFSGDFKQDNDLFSLESINKVLENLKKELKL